MSVKKIKIKSIKEVTLDEDVDVYDISMKNKNHPWFFANNILIHNTDSTYFSLYETYKDEIERGEIEWNKDIAVEAYNHIAETVSDTFPQFLKDTFNVPLSSSTGVIKSSREVVAENALFIKKKRYAALVFDKENVRKDKNGNPGWLKVTGLDLKRSDTPKLVQDFLSEILQDLLTGHSEDEVLNKVREFKESFIDKKPWQMGVPKSVNRLSFYMDLENKMIADKLKGKETDNARLPGHVRGSLNWNRLREINNDMQSMKITDGMKIIVCKLKPDNPYAMTSIAVPVDESRLPEWFTSLPFDDDEMMASVVDKKVENLLGVLKWDLSKTSAQFTHTSTFFDWSNC